MKGITVYKSKNNGKGGPIDSIRLDNSEIFQTTDFCCIYIYNETNTSKGLVSISVDSTSPVFLYYSPDLNSSRDTAPIVEELPIGLVEAEKAIFGTLVKIEPRSHIYMYLKKQESTSSIKTEKLINVIVEYVDL